VRNSAHRLTASAAQTLLALAAMWAPGLPVGLGPRPLLAQGAGQSTGRVTGTVTNDGGQPLAGAQVTLQGTRLGDVTDAEGRYAINAVPAGSYTLRVQRIGFAPATQPLTVATGQTATANVRLAATATNLDQVVVVGYGSQRRADVTSAVASVRAEELIPRAAPTPSVSNALQGKAPGVQVVTASGTPGAAAAVRVRGTNSISANAEPLYVIDGIPAAQGSQSTDPTFNPLNSINPADIESIDILKDASATSIYGARGANGVVLVTTRRGERNSGRVSLETSYGTQQVTRRINPLTGPEFRALVNEAARNAGRAPTYTDEQVRSAPTYNYVDMMLRDAPQQNHTASFSGGDQRTRYLLSASYAGQEGILVGSEFTRAGGQLNLDRDISTRARLSSSVNLTRVQQGLNRTDNGAIGASANGILSAINFDPTLAPKDSLGQWNRQARLGEQLDNPLASAMEIRNPRRVSRLVGNVTGQYDVIPGLTLLSRVGGNFGFERTPFFAPSTIQPGSPAGVGNLYTNQVTEFTNENTLNYRRERVGPGSLELLGGFSIQTSDFEDSFQQSRNFPSDLLQANNLGAGVTREAVQTGAVSWKVLSGFGRVNYSLADRYLFQASVRRDGSSRFGANNKWAVFPSASVAWRVSEEPFLKGRGPFSDVKLRASYGATGNQAINEYQSLARLDVVYAAIGRGAESIGLAPSGAAPNPDLKWEVQQEGNVGLDLGFLQNRVTLNLDVYQRTTSDLLLTVPLPRVSGFSSQLQNVGSVRNRGVEVALNTANVQRGQFTWTSTLSLAANRNRVLDLGPDRTFINPGAGRIGQFIGQENPTIVQVGQPLSTFFGYQVNGLYQQGDACPLRRVNGQLPNECAPGEYRVQDTNGDSAITSADRVTLGSAQARFYGGFASTFTFGPLSLATFLNFSQGNKVLNASGVFTRLATGFLNESEAARDRWTPENTNTVIPRANNNRRRLVYSTLVENGSFVRLQTLTLGYRVPSRFAPRLQDARLYLTGQNLFTASNYSGFDPEVNSFGGDARFLGIDSGAYPRARSYNVGLNVTF
jgi:TonB-dependent starch-binding outer membrane protein SusC